jgi:cytochrome c
VDINRAQICASGWRPRPFKVTRCAPVGPPANQKPDRGRARARGNAPQQYQNLLVCLGKLCIESAMNRSSETDDLPFRSRRAITLFVLQIIAVTTLLMVPTCINGAPAKEPEVKILVFSKTLGFRHSNIPTGIAAIRQLGTENGFSVDATEHSSAFSAENLRHYEAVVFLSATGDVLNEEQEKALKEYILAGGGFVGIHGALFGPSACEDKWAWYGELCCVSFKNHSAVVPAMVNVEDRNHPSTAGLPERWARTDEWYNYDGTPRGRAHVLMTIDESTYKGGTVGEDHPMAWCKKVSKGFMWYTAMGHTEESFREPLFLEHVLGGIEFAAGLKQGDCSVNRKPPIH